MISPEYANKQTLYNSINRAKGDAQAVWAVASNAAHTIRSYKLQAEKLEAELEARVSAERDLSTDLTDDELRVRVKKLLLIRLEDNTASAADLGQLKDLFGLTRKEADLDIRVISYSSMCEDCERATYSGAVARAESSASGGEQ